MRKRTRRILRSSVLSSFALSAHFAKHAHAVEITPIYGASFLGGQYFFAGDRSKLNGNIKANIAPALKFEDSNWSLIPLYSGNYRGTKDVSDPVGSGTVFAQGMDHRFAVTGIRKTEDSSWKLKPSLSYKRQFLKETRNEFWGKGLFDYHAISMGFEAENIYKDPFSYRVGYDFFYTAFPNYQSLESKSGVDPSGQALGRERAGTDVLDTLNHSFAASMTMPFPYNDPAVSLSASYRVLLQDYLDQPIIDSAGQPSSSERFDLLNSLGLGVSYPREAFGGRMGLGFSTSFAHNNSNQHTYDAGQTKFIRDSYSYRSFSAGPSVNFSWGEKENPITAGFAFNWSHQIHNGRRSQNGSGAYLGSKQWQDRFLVSLNYGYPIAPNFRLNAQTNILRAVSNTRYETSYRYNYTTANYLLGFSYDY